ncbi:MAG: DUF3842 family protein [Oscillospiraceae bacterium]|nr:DUF3842 family protein [Oscillospiraceae bacterium]
MNILVIDGQGGQLGGQLVKAITAKFPGIELTSVGTNAVATTAMVKAGAKRAATGENPIIVASRKADVIIGPVGIVIADSLFGEITPDAAKAVGQSAAVKILIPINKCENLVAGVNNLSFSALIDDVLLKLSEIVERR